MKKLIVYTCMLLNSITFVSLSFAQDADDLSSVLNNFDAAPVVRDEPGSAGGEKSAPEVFQFYGYLKMGMSYNFAHDAPAAGLPDWRGLSRLKPEMQLALRTRFSADWSILLVGKGFYDFTYVINDDHGYTDAVVNAYEKEFEIRDAYLQGKITDFFDIKAGKQIVAWGAFDYIRVIDVLNPMDRREPGLTDLNDLRLPLWMSRFDFYFQEWNLTAIAIHEIGFNRDPVFGSDFYPGKIAPPREEKPSSTPGNAEYALSLTGYFTGLDIGFYYANVFDDTYHVEFDKGFRLRHARINTGGFSVSKTIGSFNLKMEFAHFYGIRFFYGKSKDFQRSDVAGGIEYTGFRNTTITLEIVNRYLYNFNDQLKKSPDNAREDELQGVLSISRYFLNNALELNALFSVYGYDLTGGSFERFYVKYDIIDALSIKAGVLFCQSGEYYLLNDIDDNDRVFLELKYGF